MAVRPAFSQSVADKEQARALVAEGRELRDDKHDVRAARDRFRAAYKLIKTPIIGLDLAGAHAALSELLEAYAVVDEIGRLPVKDTESDESKQARLKAAELKAELDRRIPKLVITMAEPDAHAKVLLDGAELAPEALLVPRPVNPGPHVLEVQTQGAKPARTDVVVREGQTERVTLHAPPSAPEAASSSTQAPPAGGEQPRSSSAGPVMRVVGLSAAGVGVAGMGVSIVLGLMAKAQASSAKCDAQNVCEAQADVDKRHDATVQAAVATGVFVVGSVLAAAGFTLWLVAPRQGGPSAGVQTGAGELSVVGTF
jgi:hypothetical protein